MKILIIESDLAIGEILLQGFRDAGHQSTWVTDGQRGLNLACEENLDAVVLDLHSPRVDGRGLMVRLRARGVKTPVVLFTPSEWARTHPAELAESAGGVGTASAALQTETPPSVDVGELLDRIAAVCRRSSRVPGGQLEAGSLSLDLKRRWLSREEQGVELTPIESKLLSLLMRSPEKVVTRKILCEHVWDGDWDGSSNVIEVHVNRLRQKVARAGAESCIHTVRGRGYVFRVP